MENDPWGKRLGLVVIGVDYDRAIEEISKLVHCYSMNLTTTHSIQSRKVVKAKSLNPSCHYISIISKVYILVSIRLKKVHYFMI